VLRISNGRVIDIRRTEPPVPGHPSFEVADVVVKLESINHQIVIVIVSIMI
jgi:hypothetical protein